MILRTSSTRFLLKSDRNTIVDSPHLGRSEYLQDDTVGNCDGRGDEKRLINNGGGNGNDGKKRYRPEHESKDKSKGKYRGKGKMRTRHHFNFNVNVTLKLRTTSK
jgi:hypothetical protein